MKSKIDNKVALILIDVQKGFDDPEWGKRNNHGAEKNMARLLHTWRHAKLPVIHIKHNSKHKHSTLSPAHPGNEIKDLVRPLNDEPLLTKTVNSAFIGTDLENRLLESKITSVVLVGLTTDHCISTTARMASNLGFITYVISDATATFERRGFNGKLYSAKEMHEIALVSLENEFATILDTKVLVHSLTTRA